VRRLLGVTQADEPRSAGWSALAVTMTLVPLLFVASMAGAVETVEIAPEAAAVPGASRELGPVQQQASGPLRVGGDVAPPIKIRDVRPIYPEMAREAKVVGVVIIEAVISSTGEVEDAHVLRGNPMLDDAALDAVRQWRYTPPLLNGQPVSIIMTVAVNFTLNDRGANRTVSPLPAGAVEQTDQPIRVGGAVAPPVKIRDVRPVYPEMAREAKVQGLVILEAVISSSGAVEDARVLRGNPMLNPAAVDAVRQWRYTPPLLNGQPVSVIMTVTVNFTLNGGGMNRAASSDSDEVLYVPGPPPPPPPPPGAGPVTLQSSSFPDDIVRAGGDIPAPRKIFDAPPVYPDAARQAGVQGVVIAEIMIDVAGNVADIRVLRADPMLQDAAVDAIWQWRYEPVLVNGQAVPMVLTVTVNFTLGNDQLN
jgi:protein TonB